MARIAYEVKGATASGPYSAAVDAGDLVYFSGQTAMNSVGAKDMTGDIAGQTEICFTHLFEALEAAGLTPDNVVKANVYLTDMNNFSAMNEVYATKFSKPYPARTCVAVVGLPLGAEVEIELIAKKSN